MLYRTYLSFRGKKEYLTKHEYGNRTQGEYPLGSLTFGTMEIDWEKNLSKALSLQKKCKELSALPKRTVRQGLAHPETCVYVLVAEFFHSLQESVQQISPALNELVADHALALWRYYKEQALPAEKRLMDALAKGEPPDEEDRSVQSQATEMMLVAELMEDYCHCFPKPSPGFTKHMDRIDTHLILAAEQLLSQIITSLEDLCQLKKDLTVLLPLTLYTEDGRPAQHPGERLLLLQQKGMGEFTRCASKIEYLHTRLIGYHMPATGKIKKGSLSAALAFAGDNLSAMVFLEFQEMCIQELPVAVCAHCKRMFVPFSGNARYCQRVADPATGQTCQEIGAKIKYNRKMEDNPAKVLYNKERNKRHMRCVRAPENKKMQQDYEAWCDMAQKLLTKYELGEIDLDTYADQIM